MRLVHRDECEVDVVEQRERPVAEQALGSHVQQIELAGAKLPSMSRTSP